MSLKSPKEIEDYISGETIKCLICGKSYKSLGRHVGYAHGLTADQYREDFGLPWTTPLTSKSTRDKKSEIATENFKKNEDFFREAFKKGAAKSQLTKKRPLTDITRAAKAEMASNLAESSALTPQVFNQFLKVLKDGKTADDFYAQGVVTKVMIYKYMKKYNREAARYRKVCQSMPYAWQAANGTLNKHSGPEGRFAKRVKLMWNQGHLDSAIAETLGVTIHQVNYWTQQYRIEDVRALYDKGMSDEEIAANSPYSRRHVKKITRAWRLKGKTA